MINLVILATGEASLSGEQWMKTRILIASGGCSVVFSKAGTSASLIINRFYTPYSDGGTGVPQRRASTLSAYCWRRHQQVSTLYTALQLFVELYSGYDGSSGYCIHLGLGICFAINIPIDSSCSRIGCSRITCTKAGGQNLQLATVGIDAPL